MITPSRLIAAARRARRNAHAPYSQFQVGAALLTRSGKIFSGCNVENASFGLTICAERNAVFQAVAAGERQFDSIAIVTQTRGKVRPCGACLQVLTEFAPDIRIVIVNEKRVEEFILADLLPQGFQFKRAKS